MFVLIIMFVGSLVFDFGFMILYCYCLVVFSCVVLCSLCCVCCVWFDGLVVWLLLDCCSLCFCLFLFYLLVWCLWLVVFWFGVVWYLFLLYFVV